MPKDSIDEEAKVVGSWGAVHVMGSKDARLGEGDGGGSLLCGGGALERSLGTDAHCHEILLVVTWFG